VGPEDQRLEGIARSLVEVRRRIAAAAARAGRDPAAVGLVAVTKDVPLDAVAAAVASGVTDIGENRYQEARSKIAALAGRPVRWHFIGHLQRNKVKYVVECFNIIHSLDSLELAVEIDRRAQATSGAGRVPVLVEVNVGGETTKFGVAPEGAVELVLRAAALPGLDVQGLMTIAPQAGDPEAARPHFRRLRLLAAAVPGAGGPVLRHLSMGMSDDFEVAVEEGATLVRVGRAIFGAREGLGR
jgi:hypothetical protein